MVSTQCLAHDDPDRIYEYCPSIAASILFTILFGGTLLAHIIQAIQYRKGFCWVVITAGTWEVAGYALRSVSITQQANSGIYTAQFLLILLAPLWINAFVYMILGMMIHFFLANDRVYGVRARKVTLIFVLFDITAFCVQLAGGLMSSGDDQPVSITKLGLNIYTGGVGLQLAFIGTFSIIGFRFYQLLKKQDASYRYGNSLEPLSASKTQYGPAEQFQSVEHLDRTALTARPLFIAIFSAISLIILRNIYRLVEYGMGGINGNTITRHEWWPYVFDAVPMLGAMIILSVYHPGRVLQGVRSDFKAEDKARKAEKKARKQEKKDIKKFGKSGAKLAEEAGSSNENLV